MSDEFKVERAIRKDIQDLVPYSPEVYEGVIKLDANENPYDFPPEVMNEIKDMLNGSMLPRYPDPQANLLREAIADYVGVAPENIVAGNGSDELILTLVSTFGSDGRVLITDPTFSMYKVNSRIAGAVTFGVPRNPDFSVDIDNLLAEAVTYGTKMVFLCTPNNPTGNITPREEIISILEGLADTDCLLVLDEAYIEYAGASSVSLISKYKRLVVLRTFSKAFGLAGLRVGYMVADSEIIDEVMKVKQPYNLNTFSQLAARVVLKNREFFQEQIKKIVKERGRMAKALGELDGIEVFPSEANFILFRPIKPAKQVWEELLAKGISIRIVSGFEVFNCLRVTVGNPRENAAFLTGLKEIICG